MNPRTLKPTVVALAAALVSAGALADITVGVSLPLTGPASGLGIPMQNGFKLWPQTIAGEKVNLIILDDATDPTKGVQNARRFVTEDKVDVLAGSGATPVGHPHGRRGGREQDARTGDRRRRRCRRARTPGPSACPSPTA